MLLLALITIVPMSLATTQDPCNIVGIPSKVISLLHDKYPDWRPKIMTDLEQEDQRLWLTKNPRSCPGIAVGHFEGQDQLAYAILLVPKSEGKRGYKVVVAALTNNNNYELTILDHAEGASSSGLVISKEPPGRYSGFDTTKSVRLKLDGVNVEWLEKGSVLYYYSGGKFLELETSD